MQQPGWPACGVGLASGEAERDMAAGAFPERESAILRGDA